MKFTLFVVLSCLCICLANSLTVTTWGNVNARTLGTETIVVKSSMLRVKEHKFTYPKQSSRFPIVGIRHMDYKSHPVKVDIVDGGIGKNYVTLNMKSQRGHGMNSTFVFYTI